MFLLSYFLTMLVIFILCFLFLYSCYIYYIDDNEKMYIYECGFYAYDSRDFYMFDFDFFCIVVLFLLVELEIFFFFFLDYFIMLFYFFRFFFNAFFIDYSYVWLYVYRRNVFYIYILKCMV